MKKLLVIVMIAAMLTGCGTRAEKNTASQSFRVISANDMAEPERGGMFVGIERGILGFVDFNTLVSMPVCDDPTCKHEPPEFEDSGEKTCQAYGKTNHPFIYEDKICYIRETDYIAEGDKYYRSSELWQCSINGADNKKLCAFDKLTIPEASRSLLSDGRLYMLMIKQPYNEQLIDLKPTIVLVSVDLKSLEVKEHGEIKTSYSLSGNMLGVSGGRGLFEVSFPETDLPFMEKVEKYTEEHRIDGQDEQEALQAAMAYVSANERYITEIYELDGADYRLSGRQDLFGVTDAGCYYAGKDELTFVGTDGREHKYAVSVKGGGLRDVGDYVYITAGENAYLIDEAKQELLALKEGLDIAYIADGQAIAYSYDDNSARLKKMDISEVVK